MRTRDLFGELRFEEDWAAITDERPAYRFDFGNMELTAARVLSRHLVPVFYCGGVWTTQRELALIEFELPLEIESFEQGVALIAYFLRKDFVSSKPVWWLERGREWRHQLPWEREKEKERAGYLARPKCTVEKEWFRLAAKRLRAAAEMAGADALATLSFDGETLKICTPDLMLGVPASGTPWPQSFHIVASSLANLPVRLMAQVQLVVWGDTMRIGNRVLYLKKLDNEISTLV